MSELLEFTAQFLMIVDFAIEYDCDILIVRQDGLIAGCEIDNLKSRSAQRA